MELFRKALKSTERFSAVGVGLLFFVIYASAIPATFLSRVTWSTLAAENAVTTVVAIGLVLPLAAGVFDLSIGSVVGASGAVAADMMAVHHTPVLPAALAALGTGLVIGVLNSLLVVGLGIDSFIATLGTSSVVLAFTEWLTAEQQIIGLPASFTNVAQQNLAGVPTLFIYMVVVALLVWYVLQITPLGRRIRAAGGNRQVARLAGARPGRATAFSLIVCSLIAAFGGLGELATVAGANATIGGSYVLPVFASAFLGSTQIFPGRFNVWGTVLAVYVLGIGTKGLELMGVAPWVNDLFYGIALVGAVTLAMRKDLFDRFSVLRRMRGMRSAARNTAFGPAPEPLAAAAEHVPLVGEMGNDGIPTGVGG